MCRVARPKAEHPCGILCRNLSNLFLQGTMSEKNVRSEAAGPMEKKSIQYVSTKYKGWKKMCVARPQAEPWSVTWFNLFNLFLQKTI